MDKAIKILILLFVALIAVGASGCLGGDDSADNESDSNSNGTSDNSSISDADLNYSTNIVTIKDMPAGFTFLSTQSVKSHGENIGITDVLYGYRGYYKFTNDTVTNSTVYFYCFKTNGTAEAAKYYQDMKDSYSRTYGDAGTVTSVQINGHEATQFTTTANGPDMIAWTRANLLFVSKGQVAGEIDYATIESLADASDL